jgi:glycosyltransferase involved in cell wall biosynthesis
MLSILIPTYNYNIDLLVSELHHQATKNKLIFEIIVLDDASNLFVEENKKILRFDHTQLLQLSKNIGRTAARQQLAKKATYEYLLFMDADVFPKYDDFLNRCFSFLPFSGLIFGGIAYSTNPPDVGQMLRWKYGHARECLSAQKREQNVFETVNSGCFLIEKSIFIELNSQLQRQSYGMDLLFKQLLKKYEVRVKHIDNPVFHFGLESNLDFMKKSLVAIETSVRLEETGLLQADVRPIQKTYVRLKFMRLQKLFSLVMSPFRKAMERNFNSANPNLFWFDLYRLHYYIQLKSKKSG